MDAHEILSRFRDSARDRLVRLGEALARLDEDVRAGRPLARDVVIDVERELHAMKGEARMTGLADVAELAHAIEELIEAGERAAWPEPQPAIGALMRALDVLDRLVDERLGTGRGRVDLAAERDELVAIATAMAQVAAGSPPARGSDDAPPLPGVGRTASPAAALPDTIRVPLAALAALDSVAAELEAMARREVERAARMTSLLGLAGRLRAVDGDAGGATTTASLGKDLERALVEEARLGEEERTALARASAELSRRLVLLRRAPVSTLLADMARLVRDLSGRLGRHARVVLSGGDVEIDRDLLEALRDPILHLVQNAVDHGIEAPDVRVAAGKPQEGAVSVSVRREDGDVVAEVADDGAGLDVEGIRRVAVERGLVAADVAARLPADGVLDLVFRPGFSSRGVVSQISGRGIGLDAVRDSVMRLGGSVSVASLPGSSTRFVVRVPAPP